MKDTLRITKSLTIINSNIPTLTVNGKTATTIHEQFNAFADALEQTFTTNSDVDHTFIDSTERSLPPTDTDRQGEGYKSF
jgi:hypothetical protein